MRVRSATSRLRSLANWVLESIMAETARENWSIFVCQMGVSRGTWRRGMSSLRVLRDLLQHPPSWLTVLGLRDRKPLASGTRLGGPLRRRHRQHDAVQVRTTLVAATLLAAGSLFGWFIASDRLTARAAPDRSPEQAVFDKTWRLPDSEVTS